MPTRAGLRAIVRRDPLLNSVDVISDSDLNDILAEGVLQFAQDGHPFITKTSWTTAASTSEYVLSGGASPKVTGFLGLYEPTGGVLYAPTSSTYKFPGVDFTLVSEGWLNREYPGWKSLTASDTLQHVYVGFNSSGYHVLGTVPAAATTTPTLTVWAISSGTAMSADGNYPYTNESTALPHVEPYLKALASWAKFVIYSDIAHRDDLAKTALDLYSSLATSCREAQERVMRAEVVGLRQEGMVVANQSVGSL